MSNKNDVVNHPEHYTYGDIECIEAIKASMNKEAFCGYLKGNVLKYIWRYEHKNDAGEDLAKAKWYISRLQEEIDPIPNVFSGDNNELHGH